MDFSKFLHNSSGKCILSIILGLGFATFFRSICEGKNCIVYKAPSFDEIKDKYYKFDNDCYQFEPEIVKCNKDKNIINFA